MNAIHKASRAGRWALILISAAVLSTGALAQGSPSTTAKPAKSTAKAPAKARVPLLIEQRAIDLIKAFIRNGQPVAFSGKVLCGYAKSPVFENGVIYETATIPESGHGQLVEIL